MAKFLVAVNLACFVESIIVWLSLLDTCSMSSADGQTKLPGYTQYCPIHNLQLYSLCYTLHNPGDMDSGKTDSLASNEVNFSSAAAAGGSEESPTESNQSKQTSAGKSFKNPQSKYFSQRLRPYLTCNICYKWI